LTPRKSNTSKKLSHLDTVLLFVAVAIPQALAKSPHYTFILPDKYVGWIQIVFNDPQASQLPLKDGGYEIEVRESGMPRTSDIRVHDAGRKDEFYYRSPAANGNLQLRPVPSEYVMPGDSHGGFGVMDTGGKGPGYSWFIFIGPPEVRAEVPLADWDKVVASWRKLHGNPRVAAPDPYPTPGRMAAAPK
jgi:hypothetical protein